MALNSQPTSVSLLSSAESSSSAPRWKHDVFLSFRGEDTRRGIATDLYHELQNRGIKTFMDDQDLVIGTPISPSLLMAIEESRFAVVVLSRNYATSPWCLEELTKIVQCMDDQDRILPLFYDVEPSDVRNQKRSYEAAFIEHEEKSRHDTDKVNQWRAALKEVANLSGWDSKKYKSDRELVKDIVESVCSKLRPIEYEFAMSTVDFEAFEATRKAMNKVMKALKDDEVIAVGVYGMGGVGKTTMVKHLGAQAQKNGIFNEVIMVVVSQSPDLGKIQGALADLLGFEFKEESEIGRAARLSKEIMRRNKILIILDDIWEVLDLPRIGLPSYEELQNCNSKVLLTTRIRNVCYVMKCQEKITLNILSKQDSWTLFVRNVGWPFESSTFEDVARRVAGECCGLPIALIAVARALGDKDLVEWERAARRLEKSQTPNLDDKGDVFECIKLSYDYLKDEDSKSCFLLCCLFPEDYDIPIKMLFKYAIGKGLFRDADTMEEARETTDSVVKYLKNCSLLLESEKDGCVKMHDVIRDTAMNIAKSKDGHGFLVKAGSGLKDWPCRLHEGYSAISLMKNKLRRLREELFCIVDAKCIPKYIEVNPNWAYFNICIGSIGRHYYNQYDHNSRSLELVDTTISNLPDWFVNVVTKKIENLFYEEDYKGLSNIVMEYDHGRLHELKHLSVFGPCEKLKELMNTTTRVKKEPVFENLEELHLSCLDLLKELCVGELPPGSLINLKLLKVCDCPNLENVLLPSKLLLRLQNLEVVYFYSSSKLEYVFGCEGFEPRHSKLRKMTLFQLDSVRSICNGPAPRAIFQTLKSLVIYFCNSLGSLFTFDVAQCLFQLEDLIVERCCLLERVIEASKKTVNKKTVLPKLKNLVLVKLPMLCSGGSAFSNIECPSLEHLFLKNCPQFSFSTSASDYFGSRNHVQLNDDRLYKLVHKSVIVDINIKVMRWMREQDIFNIS